VTGTVLITTILFGIYAHSSWHWNVWVIGAASGVILAVEGAFLLAKSSRSPTAAGFRSSLASSFSPS
jgi:K+ transporter